MSCGIDSFKGVVVDWKKSDYGFVKKIKESPTKIEEKIIRVKLTEFEKISSDDQAKEMAFSISESIKKKSKLNIKTPIVMN